LHSAIYEGTVRHRRFGPGTHHEFSFECAMPLIDLDEVHRVADLHPLWSSRNAAPSWFRRADFMGPHDVALDECVRDAVEQHRGERPVGRIALLANLRTWGWIFNPISLYFCSSEDGTRVESLVADVENTPWHERQTYVVGPPGPVHRFPKLMHVSPFLPMAADYQLRYSAPSERLNVRLDVVRGEDRLLSATMSLRRQTMDRRGLGRILWKHPMLTHRVSAGIYSQAARLRLKGAPFFRHPAHEGGHD
jgi:DUF1365 family protein